MDQMETISGKFCPVCKFKNDIAATHCAYCGISLEIVHQGEATTQHVEAGDTKLFTQGHTEVNNKGMVVPKKGVAIYMTVQTLWGYVHMFVYDTGRDLMAKGVIPAENMLPETAYIKLGWALGQTNDLEKVRDIMLTPINSEITSREPYNGYLIYQGGVPEVEDFIRNFHK